MSRSLRILTIGVIAAALTAIGVTGPASAGTSLKFCVYNDTNTAAVATLHHPSGRAPHALPAGTSHCWSVATDPNQKTAAAVIWVEFSGPGVTQRWDWGTDRPTATHTFFEMGTKPDCLPFADLGHVHATFSWACSALKGTVTWKASREFDLHLTNA